MWKSDNQGFREATFIQTGRRGGVTEMQCGTERHWQWNGQSHILMWWMKIWRDTLGMRDPSPRPDYKAQDYSTGNINPHNFWL